MELITQCQCACANCGEIISYRSIEVGKIIQCPRCGEKSELPKPNKLEIVEASGPPIPEFKNCAVCGSQMRFPVLTCANCEQARRQKRLAIQLSAAATALVAVGIGGYALWRHLNPPPGSELSHVHLNISPEASNNAATDKGHILLAQPRAKLPKSTNDLKFHGFTLEKKRGSDLMTAVGDIQNVSENVHLRIQVDLDLLDKTGAKIGTVSDYCTELAANQSWHFLAAVTDPNAMSVRFARLKEDP